MSAPKCRPVRQTFARLLIHQIIFAGALLTGISKLLAANIIHEFYVPMPDAQIRTALVSIEPASGIVGTTMESVISIVVTGAGTVVHYDEWEDGYEVDINNPSQPTTKIWGDGNNANGVPPGYASDPASLASGAVINLRNQITLPRNPSSILYDGRDRFGGTKALVVTRTGWAVSPGTVLAGSVEVTATMDYGTNFIVPVGQDVSASSMFEVVGLMVMARENGTSVTVDVNGPVAGGTTTFTLNQGESYLVNGGVLKGATVVATKPVQTQLITGDIGARYETDWFTLYPSDQWSGIYYSPVGTAADGDPAYSFLYNSTASPITVNVTTSLGTGSFVIPANGIYQYQLPQNSGAKFQSANGETFFGLVMVGANPSANNVHDWGFTLVPFDSLTTEAVVGWGPGSSDLSQNGSPVWLTPIEATRVYVDYNGDRNGSLTDPKGNKYDVHYDMSALQTQRLFDPDKDQSAMRLYTLDGIQIAAAWGQDPATAGPGNPFLDVGTTVLPFPVPTLIKGVSIINDTAPSGFSIGDTIEYRIDVDNKGLLPLGNLLVLDPLNPSLTYVANSTKRDGVSIADGSSGTPFPLDESGYVIPIILRGGTTNFTYRCTINAAGSINNTASNSNYNLTSTAEVVVPPGGGSTPCGAQFTNATGTVQAAYAAGTLVYGTLTDPDANNNSGAVESIVVVVTNSSNGDTEFITLVETGANTGIFRNTTGLPTSTTAGSSQMDGTLVVAPGNSLSFTYIDPEFNETCSGSAIISTPTQTKVLYLSTDGSGSPDQDMDRIDPVAENDVTTATSQSLQATSGGGSVTLTPSKDTWLNSASNGFNYGTSTTMSINRSGGGIGSERSMLQFDLSSIPAGATITSAQLTLTKTGGSTSSQLIAAHRVTAAWTEGTQNGAAGTASWNDRQSATAWAAAGGDYNGTAEDAIAVAANGSYTWNLTSLVQGWMNGTFTNNGLILGSSDTGGTLSQQFGAREHGTTGSRPQLTVTYSTIAVDATSITSKVNPIGTVTTTHTTGTGANRLMLVGISYEDDNTAGLAVSSVTYAGQSLTRVAQQISSQEAVSEIWRLVNPPSGSGTLDVVTTGSGTGDAIYVGVATFTGVDQTTPLGTSATATASSNTASVTVTSAAGEIIFDTLGVDDSRSATADSAQTPRWNDIVGTADSDGIRAASSTKPGASSVTMTWSVGTDAWALCAVPIKPANTSSSTTFTQTPNFASAFTMPAGGALNVTSYVTVTSGTLPPAPNVTALLKHGSTTIATLTNPVYNSGAGTLVWSSALGSGVTVPTGQPIDLVLTSNQTGAAFTVRYDSSSAPSKVSLPTTTVITNTALGVYDAPYPGGNLITSPISGSTVYVRGTASDPFGAYDITSMGLLIDGPGTGGDVTTTLNASHVVNTTSSTKTYEYAWTVGSTVGTYNIATTANEGTEGINAQRATSVNVTFLDLGTPSTTEFTSSLDGPGTDVYAGNGTIFARVKDLDQDLDAATIETIQVTITSAIGDSEVVTLTETGVNTGIFVGSIPGSTTAPNTFNNGTLHAVLGDVLTVNYVDPTDPTDTGSDTATIPNIAPAVSVSKTLVTPADGIAVVGEALQYTVQVTNTGNTTLGTVSLTDTFPTADLTFVNASVTPDSTTPAGTLTWNNVGPLAQGQSITVTLNFTALSTAAPATNNAIADAGGGVTGSDFANVTITDPRITLTKTLLSPNPGPANINANVVFRITAQNTGSTAIATLPLEDTFSGADFEFVSATQTPDATGNGSLLWLDITGAGNLAIGNSISIDVTLKAMGAASPATNLARADFTTDVNGDSAPPVNSSASITLIAAKITGHVYDDVDQSITFNSGDGALKDITVSLYTDPDGDGNPADGVLVDITTTDVDGAYEFLNIPTGTYVVTESQPPGYSSSGDTAGANDNRIPVNVSTLTTFAGRNFFDYLTPPVSYASIAGKVWNDANASATVNGGEVGIENVTIDLVEDTNNNGIADLGEPVIASMLTLADGSYSFGGLSAGNYVVLERTPFNWYSTADSAAPNNDMIPVTLTSGQNVTGRDFLDVLTGTTGGKVFHDVNGSGVFDGGDVALENIDVIITDSLGATQTVVTDASGNWTASVPPGSTTIDVQQGDPQFTAVFSMGHTQTAGTDTSTITAVSGVTTPAGDDGFRQVGTVTGHLYVDTNGDGDQDSGEPNITNVDVVITKSDSTTVTVTTDGSGNWTALVPPGAGSANIDESDPQFIAQVPAGYTQTEGNDPSAFIALANDTVNAGNDGYFNAGTISGSVFKDTDNDDIGDLPFAGVAMKIFTDPNADGDPADGTQVGTDVLTDIDGFYSFGDLPPGAYVIVQTQPSGHLTVSDEDSTTPGDDAVNSSITDNRIPAAVTANETDDGNDFLEEETATISGTVLADTDNDDDGDTGISGVSIALFTDPNGDGNPVDGVQVGSAVLTDGSGNYTFTGISPGTYVVVQTQPSGHLTVSDGDSSTPGDDFANSSLTDNRIPVGVNAGETDDGNDFIEEQPGTISGTVWKDTDNNDTGDTAFANVTLTLLDLAGNPVDGDPNTIDVQPITVITSGSGVYTFTNVPPGDYRVGQTQPSGYQSVSDTDGGDINQIGDQVAITVTAGGTSSGHDFVEEQFGTISGTVFADTDNEGDGDTAMSGVSLSLFTDPNGDGDPLDGVQIGAPVLTNGSGIYTFTDVEPGNYVVVQTQPSGYLTVTDGDTTTPGDDAANGSTADNSVPVSITAGETDDGNDFIEEQPGTISGTVLKDTDNDDIGDAPFSGVSMALFTDPNDDGDPADGTQVGSTVLTNGIGVYSFGNVAPGTYVVVQTQPSGYLSITDGDTTTPGDDAANSSTLDNHIPVAVSANETDDGNDFVEEQAGSIEGCVHADADNDNDGDTYMPGVTLTLFTDPNGDGDPADGVVVDDPHQVGVQPYSTLTDSFGIYYFTQLAPGAYVIVQIQPPGYLTVKDEDITADDLGSPADASNANTLDNRIPVNLGTGETDNANDFIEEQPATIGNLVWNDVNNDGIKDLAENGIDGVVIELLDSAGVSIDSDPGTGGVQPTLVTTASGGLYSFSNLPPASYRLRIATPPALYPLSSVVTDTNNNGEDNDDNGTQPTPTAATISPVIALGTGETDSTVDFGFTAISTGSSFSIVGQVRDDFDLDGSFSDNDQPVPSVTVRLYADTNDDGDYDPGIDQLIATTTTDGLGFYTLTSLPNGKYFVIETDPTGSTSTADTQGGNDNLISVTLAGSSSTGNDFLDAVDPAGYAYDVVTGQIIPGGSISVSGPGSVTILMDGSSGQYSFIVDGTPGNYTITYTPPTGYIIDPTRPVAGSSFDPTGGPDPTVLGSYESSTTPGYLTDFTAVGNPWYVTFTLAAGDPLVINNNIPLRLAKPKRYTYWKKVTPGGGPTPGDNGDGDCYSDLLEYALDLDPSTGVQTTPAFRGTYNTGTGKIDAMFNRAAGGLEDVTYTLMGITDLSTSPGGWTALTILPVVTSNGDGTETVTFPDLESDPLFTSLTEGIVRLRVEIDEDDNNIPELTANTPAYGWTRRHFNAECVMTGHPYLKAKNFCGAVDSVTGATLDVTTTTGAESIVDQFTSGREYFIEVFSGDNAGHRFEIDEAACTATTIVLDAASVLNTQTSIPANLATDKVVIREHWTLNELFPAAQFGDTNTPATADKIMFYNRATNAFITYWLYTNGGTPKWVLQGDGTLADQGGRVMESSEGWFTHPRNGPQDVVWHGMVRANPFAVPLKAGPNFIGDGWPMMQSTTMRGMSAGTGFSASRNPALADQILFWKGYATDLQMAYYSHFLLSYGAMHQWTPMGNASLTNDNALLMFRPTTGSIYKMRAPLPGYVMPAAWTP